MYHHIVEYLNTNNMDSLHDWMKARLTQHLQHVVVNGCNSNFVKVQSGVPQGTVLRPLILLITSTMVFHLIYNFLQIIVFYRTINSQQDNYTTTTWP